MNRFRITTVSGALTAITAYTTSAGHLLTFRNPAVAAGTKQPLVFIDRVQLQFQVTVQPSAQQDIGFSVRRTTAHTVNAAVGGGAVTTTTPQGKLDVLGGVPAATIYYANSTTVLTAGTYTPDTLPLGESHAYTLVAGAANPKEAATLDIDLRGNALILGADEGLVVANVVLMANSLAGILTTTIEWREGTQRRDATASYRA